ncbi:hypothetical protein [Nonomuraea africana]|uniref:Uncharacterized protein n=1 Tax=Nonomuraea africana TaxID=46171 RepID=A0ABR9KTT3_9ACTN|nr:hypothetical protein [Nonomuraea africana]MBE1565431.1 hypothetical protein [Nonomuraea africana]
MSVVASRGGGVGDPDGKGDQVALDSGDDTGKSSETRSTEGWSPQALTSVRAISEAAATAGRGGTSSMIRGGDARVNVAGKAGAVHCAGLP